MLIVFILSNTFSLQFSALKNPSMYPVKDAYRATNHRDEYAQMTVWLERREKILRHESYLISKLARPGSDQTFSRPVRYGPSGLSGLVGGDPTG